MGNWIFYYLSFGSYATVAMLDSGAVLADLLAEIPTGALTDLIGKKKALILAFASAGIGNILMGTSNSLWMLAISLWLFVCAGGAFYSGTMEALVYDSLKATKDEDLYDRKIGGINATKLWSMAICSVIGGYAYYIYPGLPLILNGAVTLVGLVACFFLTEPVIDSEKYSWSSFFKQNTLGIKSLFSGTYMRKLSIYLIAAGAMSIVIMNILDDLLAVEWGYSPIGISYLFAGVCLVAGFASMYLPRMKIRLNQRLILIVSMILTAVTLLLSPIVGMVLGGALLLLRVVMEVFFDNATSVMVNMNIESKVRATTLSSLNLLRCIPYALGGSFIGGAVLLAGSARNFALWFGLVLLIVTVGLGTRIERKV